jgi:transcriptional regulator with XRE-family HTH domain
LGASLQDEVRERFRLLREAYSLRELEDRTGVSIATLSNFLAGRALGPTKLRELRDWLDAEQPEGTQIRTTLVRALGGLPRASQTRIIEGLHRLVREEYNKASVHEPPWVLSILKGTREVRKGG